MRGLLTAQLKNITDLSFYPESYMVEEALKNPVEFGKAHSAGINALIDLANVQLPGSENKIGLLVTALASKNPWHRYWGCIVASSQGKSMEAFVPTITKLAERDPNPLVRTRAAEFLGLTGAADPRPAIMSALKMSKSPVATNLILNTATLLQDGKPGYQFEITRADVNQSDRYIEARIVYLSAKTAPPKRKKPKKKKQE
jgi:HEAT repeat protein